MKAAAKALYSPEWKRNPVALSPPKMRRIVLGQRKSSASSLAIR
jgi:hypothetical protein